MLLKTLIRKGLKNKTKLNILFLIIIISIIVYYKRGENHTIKEIKNNIGFATGIVLNSSASHRGGIALKFKFYNKDSIYYNSKTLGIYSGFRNKFSAKTFLVVFSLKDPNQNEMLMLPEDFNKYGLQYPDSLNWVLKYLK